MVVAKFEFEGSRSIRLLFSNVSGGGIERMVARVPAIGGVVSRGDRETDDDNSDEGDSGSESGAGAEDCESCEWLRTGGGSSVGMGGGIVATVYPDDLDIFDETESRE